MKKFDIWDTLVKYEVWPWGVIWLVVVLAILRYWR